MCRAASIGYQTFFVQLTFDPHRSALREKGFQYFLRGAKRESVYPKDMWHGGTNYPRISCTGIPKSNEIQIKYSYKLRFCYSYSDKRRQQLHAGMLKKGKSSTKKGKAEACEPETELQAEQQPEQGSTERAGSMEPELTVEAESEHQAVCPICEQVIVDPSDEEDGEDSVFCDSECQCWLHRCCACLPKTAFEKLNKQVPFYCPRCSS